MDWLIPRIEFVTQVPSGLEHRFTKIWLLCSLVYWFWDKLYVLLLLLSLLTNIESELQKQYLLRYNNALIYSTFEKNALLGDFYDLWVAKRILNLN